MHFILFIFHRFGGVRFVIQLFTLKVEVQGGGGFLPTLETLKSPWRLPKVVCPHQQCRLLLLNPFLEILDLPLLYRLGHSLIPHNVSGIQFSVYVLLPFLCFLCSLRFTNHLFLLLCTMLMSHM